MEVPMKYRWCTWTALCIAVLMMTASIQGADTNEPQNFALDSMGYYFSIEIMNRIYNDSLLDPESADYKKMHGEVSTALHSVYGCDSCPTGPDYKGVQAMNFRKGSVIAESTIMFSGTMTNTAVVKFLFMGALANNPEINGLQINPESISEHTASSSSSSSTTTTTKSKSSPETHTGQNFNNTEPVLITSNPPSNHDDGVPGWAIALLVLASIAILLLIIIIIILEDLTQSPKPKPNRTGTYVVNPER
ncbi:hypothetical protein KOW79_010817 [Hemibagrus wyckioides]|uniref:Mucin-1 n=1 Tax=Hemibagrus wyckioides TaxID=337641 RepID=A0A9D3NS11_9TELE|nr:hypothetical protein KOW79_010817 [Hemibagrus wyckioides]